MRVHICFDSEVDMHGPATYVRTPLVFVRENTVCKRDGWRGDYVERAEIMV